ncbi:MAG: ABC transporter ATP-binding protein [Planctomycetia bacterium]|uniref:ABC transporter ATP-binding protein n=1 Tax=Candidatus Kuenenia sp. TaxID=2499824 RepID=UPI001DBF7D83|nr:ABC transporter ATP-binding protein [Planctomycetia bacterium]
MKTIFSKFLYLFNRREKLQIFALFILILVSALFETFGVGLMYPFISILKNPEVIHSYRILHWFYVFMGMGSLKEFLIWAVIGLIAFYLLKNAFLVLLAYAQSRFIYNKQILFAHRLFVFYLNQPYTFHVQRNTAELLHKINVTVSTLFSGFLLYAIMFVIEIITTLSILSLLIILKPLPSIIAVSVLGVITIFFYKLIRKKIGKLGEMRHHFGEQMVRWVTQGLGGIKETKVLGREGFFANEYNKNSKGYVNAERFLYVINQLPRPFLETICILSMFLIMLLMMAQNKDLGSIIPTLSLFAMAAFRIIPSMNRIFAAATLMRYNSSSVEIVYNELTSFDKHPASFERAPADVIAKTVDKPKTPAVSFPAGESFFDNAIELKNVSYQYPNTEKAVLNGISLVIPKHYSIGFVGPSGAGKTTLVDVIIGLLTPTHGEVLVDGKIMKDNLSDWQRRIGYIPQSIYLSDDTIRRNIAFGLPDEQIDEDQIWSVLESAQLKEFVNNLPDKLGTFVGERGIRLSGGQRQRIGIARALYRNPEVLVMDEGTASLDNETEWEIMQTVKNLRGEKTTIIIAHRLSTIKNCNLLYFIKDGTITDYGVYDELFDKSQEFKSMVMATEYK